MMNSAAILNVMSSVRRLTCMSVAFPKIVPTIGLKSVALNHPVVHRSLSCTCPSTKSFIVKDNDEFMQRVMSSDDPVIVNFHAEWCDPCKILSPKLKELVDPLDHVHLAIVDVEANAELVHTFEVKAVPAVIAVRNGLVVDKFIGLVDADMIENLVNKLSGKGYTEDSSTETNDTKGTPIGIKGGPIEKKDSPPENK